MPRRPKPPKLRPVERGEYGQVLVIKGRLKGKVCLYDDNAETPGMVIVYPSVPWLTSYAIVRLSSLAKATRKQAIEWERWNMNELAWRRASKAIRDRDRASR